MISYICCNAEEQSQDKAGHAGKEVSEKAVAKKREEPGKRDTRSAKDEEQKGKTDTGTVCCLDCSTF